MKRHVAGFLLFIAFNPAMAQESEVHATFKEFQTALAAKNFSAASSHIDDEAVNVFERMRSAALSAEKTEIAKQPAWFAISALMLRHMAPVAELEHGTGRDIFILAHRYRTYLAPVLPSMDVTEIRVYPDGQQAEAQLTTMGHPFGHQIRFLREHDQWRIAWSPYFPRFAEEASKFRPGRDSLLAILEREIRPMIEKRTGRDMSSEVFWTPLNRRAP